MEIPSGQRKIFRGHFMAVKEFHESCRKCRECSREQKCTVCMFWSTEDWVAFIDGPKLRSDKKTRRTEFSAKEVSITTNPEEISVLQGGSTVQSSSSMAVENFGTPPVSMVSSDGRHFVDIDSQIGANIRQPATSPVSRPGSISHVDNRPNAQGGHYPNVGMTAGLTGEMFDRNTSYSDTIGIQPSTGDLSPSTGDLSLSTGDLAKAIYGIQQWMASHNSAACTSNMRPD